MQLRVLPGGTGTPSGCPLFGELPEPVARLAEPVDPVLEQLPLGGHLAVLLQQPGTLVLLLQHLHHGFLQVVAVLPEDEELNQQRDLVGKTLAGFL